MANDDEVEETVATDDMEGADDMEGMLNRLSEGMEEVEEEDLDDMSLLATSEEDAEQKRRYKEYLALVQEIESQNKTVEDLKCQIMELCRRPCKSACDMKQIKSLHACMEQENLKLRCLITKAMQLQNYGSRRRYRQIEIATTITEDQMAASYVGCMQPPAIPETGDSEESCGQRRQSGSRRSKGNDCNKTDARTNKINQALNKLKICCPEDRKLIEEIAKLFLKPGNQEEQDPCGPSPKRRNDPCSKPSSSPCPPPKKKCPSQSPCSQGGGAGGSPLAELKKKIMTMQNNVSKLMQEIKKREGGASGSDCGGCNEANGDFICSLKSSSSADNADICNANGPSVPKCGPQMDDDMAGICGGKRNTKSNQIEKLKQNYLHLLSQYEKKNTQCQEMEKRIKSLCSGCGSGGGGGNKNKDCDGGNDAELELLRERVIDLKEEQAEFKCLIKEQASQVDDYRQKYLMAQQTVEEQCVMLEKLNMNNKRIEKQINIEVKEIRAKFQEKLNDLMHLPKLLENEQLKLAKACKEKEELQAKLGLVCKELKAVKDSMKESQQEDCRPKLLQCTMELEKAKQTIEELTRQRDLFCEQLATTQDDLDTLRSESAKIIARTKERAEVTRQQMQQQMNKLEKDLAQCRATASLSVTDREAVIREMQGQLNTLSYSFDAAQKQIKTLRNHIAYVSNENCFPVKC